MVGCEGRCRSACTTRVDTQLLWHDKLTVHCAGPADGVEDPCQHSMRGVWYSHIAARPGVLHTCGVLGLWRRCTAACSS